MHEHDKQGAVEETVAELKGDLAAIEEIEVEILEELIDLERQAKEGREPRRARRYRIRIDKDYYEVTAHSMTGREILALAGKTPDKYMLSEKLRGGQFKPVEPDETVEFHRHHIERFQTLARDATAG